MERGILVRNDALIMTPFSIYGDCKALSKSKVVVDTDRTKYLFHMIDRDYKEILEEGGMLSTIYITNVSKIRVSRGIAGELVEKYVGFLPC